MVCVVDDDLSLLRALQRLLGGEGFSVATFASAEEFLDFPGRAHAACLVVDVHLGGCSGFELQEQLAAHGLAHSRSCSSPPATTRRRGSEPGSPEPSTTCASRSTASSSSSPLRRATGRG